jgi:Pvc16 N-terminal domain
LSSEKFVLSRFPTGEVFVAKAQAIAVTGQTVLGLLADNIPKSEFANARFELYQTANFSSPMEEGISLFLYRVEVNSSLRNLPVKTGLDGITRRPPLPLDLYYLLTVWAKDAVRQQRILGWAMRTLEDASVLSAGRLNHFGTESDVFQPGETVELIFQTLSLQDLSNLWSAFKTSIPVSVAYIARIVGIDSTVSTEQTAPVQTREMDFVQK